MLVNPQLAQTDIKGEMHLYIDKMSRLFFFSDSKYFSFNFPFQVSYSDEKIVFYSKYLDDINSKVSSEILSLILSDKIHNSSCVLDFSSEFLDLAEYSEELWKQYFHLLTYEDGYIRFDHDPEHENGNLHPLTHLDVFYSNVATFKIGTDNNFSQKDLIDLVDINTPCSFLVK